VSTDPAGALECLAARSAGGLPHLLAARERTGRELGVLRARLEQVDLDPGASIVLFGSWGRGELTDHSDNDWLMLVDGAPRADISPRLDELGGLLSGDRRPGDQGLFGVPAFSDDLAGNIGLDRDHNANLTQRMLLMLESRPVANDAVHQRCWEQVLDGYLEGEARGYRPPRFFLNDLVRYWRTIGVDFAGKERAGAEGWALRNAKLRTSRKVLFAGGLLPLLRCHEHDRGSIRPFLMEQLRAPATDRIAAAFLALDAADAGSRALSAYDRWIGLLAREEIRRELTELPREEARSSALFIEVRRLASQLEQGLLSLLFESSPQMAAVVREYMVF
jgi:hypothetical protein